MELWASIETTEKHLHPGTGASANDTTTRQKRRLTDGAILSLFRHWLLSDYINAYTRSLAASRIFRHCYVIDALGVEGKKQTVALKQVTDLSQTFAQEQLPMNLHGIVLTSQNGKRTTAQTGEQQKANNKRPKESQVLATNWMESGTTLLKEIEQSPAVVLLNPLAPVLLSAEQVTPLYQRTVPTELCLLFSHKQIMTLLQAAQQNQAQGMILTSLLRSSRWKSLSRLQHKSEDSLQKSTDITIGFLDLFLASMRRYFQLPPQSISLPVRSGPASTATLPYTLLFATRRQESMLHMNDALCIYQRNITQQSYQGVLSEEWFQQQEQERQRKTLADITTQILHIGQTQRIRRWPDLRQQLVTSHFGLCTQEEYDHIMQHLLASQQVTCQWRQIKAIQEASTPGNNDTLVWH